MIRVVGTRRAPTRARFSLPQRNVRCGRSKRAAHTCACSRHLTTFLRLPRNSFGACQVRAPFFPFSFYCTDNNRVFPAVHYYDDDVSMVMVFFVLFSHFSFSCPFFWLDVTRALCISGLLSGFFLSLSILFFGLVGLVPLFDGLSSPCPPRVAVAFSTVANANMHLPRKPKRGMLILLPTETSCFARGALVIIVQDCGCTDFEP